MEPDLFSIEKRYRAYTFLGLGTTSGLILIGRLLAYESWRSTAISLVFLLLVGAIAWGIFGYAYISNQNGGYMYGQRQQTTIAVLSIPAVLILAIVFLGLVL